MSEHLLRAERGPETDDPDGYAALARSLVNLGIDPSDAHRETVVITVATTDVDGIPNGVTTVTTPALTNCRRRPSPDTLEEGSNCDG